MRIALGLIMQETHSFSPLPTGIDDFRESPMVPYAEGDDMIDAHRHAESEMGGFIEACEAAGVEMVPLFATFAVTSGPVTAEAFAWLRDSLIDQLRAAGPVDGVLIAQHGAMAAEDIHDPEGDILASITDLVGPDVPVGCSLDMHGNLTQKMVDHTRIIVCYETHRDYREIAARTATLLFRCIREDLTPVHYLRKLPMVLGRSSAVLEDKRRIEDEDDHILAINVLACNPWTDVEEFGPTILVTATHAAPRFETIRDELARDYWNARYVADMSASEGAIANALQNTGDQGPVILQDACDIVGGGAIGDDVTSLTQILAAGAKSVGAIIYDPEAAAKAFELGEGAQARLPIGGKIGKDGAPPLQFEGTIRKLYDGEFELVGPPYGGMRPQLGRTACIGAGDIDILVMSKRIYPQPGTLFDTLEVNAAAKQILLLKDVNATQTVRHKEVIDLLGPGLTTWDFTEVPFRNVSRPRFPMDDIAEPF